MASVCEETNRYKDMIIYLKLMTKNNIKLNHSELEMLNIAYQNLVIKEHSKLKAMKKMKKQYSLEKMPVIEEEILIQEKRLFEQCNDLI